MNWKNVLYLLRVERKSGRLIRGIKATHYTEHGVLAYWPYWTAAIIGVLAGLLANFIVDLAYSDASAAAVLPPIRDASLGFFVAMPTVILLVSIVFSMLQQFQISSKVTTQVNYWLPITWQEHTAASILANLLGWPLALVTGAAAGIIVFSVTNGLIVAALITTVAMLATAFIGSSITELAGVVITRFTGAVYKSSGKAAIWIRLISTLIVIAVGYTIYFSIITGTGAMDFIQVLSNVQTTFWVIPFLWPAVVIFYLMTSNFLFGAVFIAASALFMAGVYYLAVLANQHYGLYEPPAIKVQTSGVYTPKTGILGKLGFTTGEAAIIQKDIRSFTRRRELISVFIVPIVFILVPIFNSMSISGQTSGAPGEVNLIFAAMIFLGPAAFMAMLLGNSLIGEEGQAVWRIYASPLSPKNLVKSKFAFQMLFSILILAVTGTVGVLFFQPTPEIIVLAFLEGLFLAFAVGSIGLTCGFKGADFTMSRRARMIRQEWALISLLGCALAGLAVLAPLAPYLISSFLSAYIPLASMDLLTLAISLVISGVVAAVITAVFYRINIGQAEELIRKAEI
jgi:ABC-2 type transport system permease protein